MREKLTVLEDTIVALLHRGIPLSADTLFFAESTYGLSPPLLEEALNDVQFDDRDILLALILTPDHTMRVALEPLLVDFFLPADAVEPLAAAVHRQVESIRVLLPDGAVFLLEVDGDDICYLIDKLYIGRSIDPSVSRALEHHFPDTTVIESRLILRCRGDYLGPVKNAFLAGFISKCGPCRDIFVELFSFLVRLLGEVAEHDSIDRHLLERQRQVIKTIRNIELFKEKQQHYSMEYLMMQRYPVPHESEDEMIGQLCLLRTITETVLGHPPDHAMGLDAIDLGRYRSGTDDMGRLIRVLSEK